MVKGVDVSEFQGEVDWARAKAAGVGFAMLRAGYGKGNADAHFAANAAACNALSIPFGVYWFGYPLSVSDAEKEAEYCAEALKSCRVTFPVAYDFEYNSVAWCVKNGVTADGAFATACAKAFCEGIRKAGYTPAVYTNADFADRMFDLSALSDYELWYAYYQPEPERETDLWQYTSSGTVSGIAGNVDMNIAYKDYGAAESAVPAEAETTETTETTETAGTAEPAETEETFEMTMTILKRGSTGKSVKALQILLSGYGYDPNGIDGIFGPGCESAVKRYQSASALDADGYVGPLTWGSLLK